MRAWQVQRHGAPRDALRLVEIDEPTPGPGEVRLRVSAAAIGMPDAFMCQSTYALTPPLPFVPGQEVCGVVDAVGPDVDIALGTRIMAVTSFTDGRGGFAESTIVRAVSAFRVPADMSDVDAAGFRIGFSTAWIGLVRRGALREGEWLLVLGAAGGSGATAVQLGRALGARVIAVASGADKVAFCRRMGADVVIDRSVESVPEAVRAATGDHGADVIYDPVGGEPAEASLRCIAPFGRLLAVGFASGRWVKVDTVHAVRRNYSLVGVYAGGFTRQEAEDDHEALLALAAQSKLTSFAHTAPFSALPDAVEAVANGTVIGKTVVTFG
ncbi:MAG TPA: NADPH:quinone oxidoreductase family protein [Acidimicrobiales bacterium]|nr:NADPH:quinone oxidoreductase family protein [Acidimicrobiales bacterium]